MIQNTSNNILPTVMPWIISFSFGCTYMYFVTVCCSCIFHTIKPWASLFINIFASLVTVLNVSVSTLACSHFIHIPWLTVVEEGFNLTFLHTLS